MSGTIREALWPEVIALALAGQRVTEIAEKLHVHHSVISRTLAHPEVRQVIQEHWNDTLAALRAQTATAARRALRTLERLATDEKIDPKVQLAAASDLLDRAGLSRGAVLEVNTTHRPERPPAAPLITAEEARALTDEQLERALAELRNDP